VAALLEAKVEVLEAEAEKGGPLTKGPLAELSLPREVLVAAVRKGGALRVPLGNDRIDPGDRVLLISSADNASKLAAFLSG
jgi:Trk K+ transport system NAD-binding subunit